MRLVQFNSWRVVRLEKDEPVWDFKHVFINPEHCAAVVPAEERVCAGCAGNRELVWTTNKNSSLIILRDGTKIEVQSMPLETRNQLGH